MGGLERSEGLRSLTAAQDDVNLLTRKIKADDLAAKSRVAGVAFGIRLTPLALGGSPHQQTSITSQVS